MARSTHSGLPAVVEPPAMGIPTVQEIPPDEFDLEFDPKKGGDGGGTGTRRRQRGVLAELPEEPDDTAAFPPAAQAIISDIIGQLRHSNDLASILQFAIEALTQVCQAERVLIWQVEGDQLAVTNEFTFSGQTCFVGNQLNAQ